MHPFTHVLCPVDFSEFSLRALDLGIGLAADFKARLSVATVADTRDFAPTWAVPSSEQTAANRRSLEARMADLAKHKGLQPDQVRVLDGIPHQEILKLSGEAGCDLVVMGTHGTTGFERLVLGSVTEKVLHGLEIPLLTVSPAAQRKPPPADSPRRFQTILLATDLGPQGTPTIEHGLSLARRYGSRLLLLNVIPNAAAFFGPMEAPWLVAAELEKQLAALKQERHEKLLTLVPEDVRHACMPEFFVREGVAEHVILDMADKYDADLVVLGAHGFGKSAVGWVGATCHRVIRSAPCPVLAVRVRA